MKSPTADALVETYLQALSDADAARVISLFTPDGIVNSPLYGELPAREFYPMLFADTAESVLSLRKTLLSPDGSTLAFWFDFGWVLADGTPAPFTVVDVAELDERGLIFRLHIVYDTHPIRDSWTRQHHAENSG
ncbi:nuclear transport factor 2 family protein [Arthrobacter sp. 24S4-2]|uniref:nuclear transport factor 2 family protein n=1 Tax=Arthrobacter sp. 24S4-2 TaxID=2575374 RepID=UPI0010C7BE64|nr:nuclear transport factor 2 family protein [Arthrobacter sp. 24S4-2]QCP00106.1 nuclear transport factor 2 family protein [Arthrobacter sp. 24S4-2]